MRTHELFEAPAGISKTVVILPGGFHPFHPGHLSLYQSAQKAFPGADIYYAATNDKSERPFDFADKQALAYLAGVPKGRFVQVKSPFMAKEIVDQYDPNTTAVVFARSEKDKDQPPHAGGTKKDGSPSYLQPWNKQPQPAAKHAYMAYLPTVQFQAGKSGITSATQIRDTWPRADDAQRDQIAADLYPKDPTGAKQILNKYLGESQLGEDAAGVGLVRNSNDPRYVMATMGNQNDVTSKTLGKMMKAYHLVGTKAPKTRQKPVKGNIAEASDPSGLLAAAQLNKSFIITADLAEGGTKKFRVRAQSERVAREKFSRHYNQAKIVSVVEEGVAETALNPRDPRGDYEAKRKALHDLSLDKNVDQKAVQQRRLDLDKEAKAKGVAEGGNAFMPGIKNTPEYKQGFATGKLPVPYPEGSQQYVNYYKGVMDKAGPKGVAEFAPPGGGDGDDGFSDETLKRLAAEWYNGDEDPRVEKTLAAAGWEIGQDEGYDDEPGVFVVQAGDVNGNSYMSWPAHELRQGKLKEFAPGGPNGGGSDDMPSIILSYIQRTRPELFQQYGQGAVEEVVYDRAAMGYYRPEDMGENELEDLVMDIMDVLEENYGPAESRMDEKWSQKYKRSIDCSHPKGFSQKAHCAGRKKNEARDPRDWDEGNTEPPNNYAVYINGKKWKVFPAGNWYADSVQERNRLRQLQDWANKKSAATGKKWTVHLTGEAPTTEMKEDASRLRIGDPVIITGRVQFQGKTGDIDSFGEGNRFVVVNLYNHGKHSFHASDVSYNDYADQEEVEEDLYQYNKEDPFNSTFAPRVGMGSMTLRGWKQSMARRVAQLAQELESAADPKSIDHSYLWDNVYAKLKNLNLDPIAQEIELAHQELERIRRQGGIRARAFKK